MNLTQIEAIYTDNLNELLLYCFTNIERAMVENIHEIKERKSFSIEEKNVNRYYNFFPLNYKKDIIKEIKQKYAENWEVIFNSGNKRIDNHFIFTYIEQPLGPVSHIEHQDTITVNKEDKPIKSRSQILDLS